MCFPPALLTFPASYREGIATFHGRLEADPIVTSGQLLAVELKRFKLFGPPEAPDTGGADAAEDIYPCVLYVPAAIGLEIVRPLNPSVSASILIARLCSVALCGLVIVAGLRLMPFAKEVYAFVALLPMVLHQLGSVSPDATVISLALFTTAYLLRLAVRRPNAVLTRGQAVRLVGLGAALGFAKIDILLLGLLPMIPASRFGTLRRRLTILAACAFCALATLAIVPRMATLASSGLTAYRATQDIRDVPNAEFLFAHPIAMLGDLFTTLHTLGSHYVTEIVGTFAWLAFELPSELVSFIVITAFFLGMRSVVPARSVRRVRAYAIGLSIVSLLAVFGSLFITNEHFNDLPGLLTGTTLIPGVQGRYFLPFALFAPLALSVGRRREARIDRVLCLYVAGVTLLLSIRFLAQSFFR